MKYDWLHLHTEARNDAKLRTLTDAQHRVWFNLLCMAAEQVDERGTICGYDLDDSDDAELLALEASNGDVDLLLRTVILLERLRIVRVTRNVPRDMCDISFINFLKRNYDKPSDQPNSTAERKRAQRERQKHAQKPAVGDMSRPVTRVTHRGEEIRGDKNIVNTKESEDERGRARALEPTLKAVPKPPPRESRSTSPPADFEITPELRAWAGVKVPAVGDLLDATEEWLDWARREGKKFNDWDAAWRNGMKRAQQFALERQAKRASANGTGKQSREEATVEYFERAAQRFAARTGSGVDVPDRPGLRRAGPEAPG